MAGRFNTPIPTSTTQPLLSAIKGAFTHNEIQVKQECIPVGCVPPALYRTGGGSLSKGVSVQEEGSTQGGLCRGRGICPGGCLCHGDPPPCGQINSCENITLPQTLFAGCEYWSVIQSIMGDETHSALSPLTQC